MEELNRMATVAIVVKVGTGNMLCCGVDLPALTNMAQPEM